jgi:hypothetical protein
MLKESVDIIEAKHQDKYKHSIYEFANDIDEDIKCDICRSDEYEEGDMEAPIGSS